MENTVPQVLVGAAMKIGQRNDNCGLSQPCPDGSVAVAVDTGQANIKTPSICVDNYM